VTVYALLVEKYGIAGKFSWIDKLRQSL
jgi:hypothetical protein